MAYQVNGTTRISNTSVVSGTFNGTTVDGTVIYGSTGIRLPSVASEAGRPSSPPVGLMIFRTDEDFIEVYNGTEWVAAGGGEKLQDFTQQVAAFDYTGSNQTLQVPVISNTGANITAIRVKMWGAGGTGGGNCSDGTAGADGSCGSFVDAFVPVTAGESLSVLVGGAVSYTGNNGSCNGQSASQYGGSGCGNQGGTGDGGGANGNSGGSGGGGSSIVRGSTTICRAAGGSGGGGCGYGGTRTQAAASATESNGAGGTGRGAGGGGGSGGANCGGGGGGGSGSSRNQGGGSSGNKNTSLVPSNTTAYTGAPQSASAGSGRTPSGTGEGSYVTNVATGGIGGAGSGSNGVGQRGGGPGRVVVFV